MNPPDITHSWTWTGGRDIPDWLARHHHFDGARLVIHTPDGHIRPEPGWWLIHWSDDAVTTATPRIAERVYGTAGLHGRLERAEADLAALRQVARGYCPDCGRGDAAPTVENWETERRRADTAEQRVQQIADLRDRWLMAGAPPLGTSINR